MLDGAERAVVDEVVAAAGRVVVYDPHAVPAALRTEAYAAAVSGSVRDLTGNQLALIPEHCLTRPDIPVEVAGEQLARLLDNPGAWRVVPASHPTSPGFTVLEVEHFHPIVHIELLGRQVILEDRGTTTRYLELAQELERACLPADEGVALVEAVLRSG
ncbi:Scr1 family TA system antitoxin-like transcriptional regulator [Actinokineospora bangkokensis]|uniref:Scr1 family TA system antitoxin-like transcriptional regulator n=1 Tax=Actinokineospora bangkokensis TaxID=1193682 RepID=UPI00117756E0|nr:Scr1 family TA system antitoxin-like transcriptional regulator [Actinokineospora bangkokensis]